MAQRVTPFPPESRPDTSDAFPASIDEAMQLTAQLHQSSVTLSGKYTQHTKPNATTVTLPAALPAFADAETVHYFAPAAPEWPGLVVVPGDATPTELVTNDHLDWLNQYCVHGSNGRTITLPASESAFEHAPNVFQFQLPPTAHGYQPLLLTPALGPDPTTE